MILSVLISRQFIASSLLCPRRRPCLFLFLATGLFFPCPFYSGIVDPGFPELSQKACFPWANI